MIAAASGGLGRAHTTRHLRKTALVAVPSVGDRCRQAESLDRLQASWIGSRGVGNYDAPKLLPGPLVVAAPRTFAPAPHGGKTPAISPREIWPRPRVDQPPAERLAMVVSWRGIVAATRLRRRFADCRCIDGHRRAASSLISRPGPDVILGAHYQGDLPLVSIAARFRLRPRPFAAASLSRSVQGSIGQAATLEARQHTGSSLAPPSVLLA